MPFVDKNIAASVMTEAAAKQYCYSLFVCYLKELNLKEKCLVGADVLAGTSLAICEVRWDPQ